MKERKVIRTAILLVFTIIIIAVLGACDYTTESLIIKSTDITEEYGEFSSVNISTSLSNVHIEPSSDGKTSVVCRESEKVYNEISVEGGVLSVKEVDERDEIDKAKTSINIQKRSIIVYISPDKCRSIVIEGDVGEVSIGGGLELDSVSISSTTGSVKLYSDTKKVNINSSTGNVKIEKIKAENVNVSSNTGSIGVEDTVIDGDFYVNSNTGDINILYTNATGSATAFSQTGKIQVTSMKCKALKTESTTGKTILHSVIADESINAKSTTGGIRLIYSDSKSIELESSIGDITASLLSEKKFDVSSGNNENIVCPPSSTEEGAGECKITTSLGNITVTIEKILQVE